jgi:sulfoxide reductase heme-binding subunit YedZ
VKRESWSARLPFERTSDVETVGRRATAGWPWTGPDGRPSPFKLAVFLALLAPAAWIAANFLLGALGPRPWTEAIHQIGLWAIRLLFLSLAITPARRILQWPELLVVRRMIGVAAFCYAFIHLCLYMIDEKLVFFHIADEIVRRIYLTIGFTALVGLTMLAATSTDGMVRRLGGRWRGLHSLLYGIAALAVIHMFMQSKADVYEATWMAGLLVWMLGYRLLARRRGRGGRVPLWQVGILGIAVGVITAVGESVYFWWKMGVAPTRVLVVNLSLATGVRPGWIVVAAGLGLAAVGALVTARKRRPARAAI